MNYNNILEMSPPFWTPMDENSRFSTVPLDPYSQEYMQVRSMLAGNYYRSFEAIYRVQNPLLWAKYRHRCDEYTRRGKFEIMTLYHDTSEQNINSISERNFDWRFGERFKFGPGVYFSIKPDKACKHSSKLNGRFRAMFVVDVLVQNVLVTAEDNTICLPFLGYDTVLAHNDETYVKYFDCEYYPKYFMLYQIKDSFYRNSASPY